MASDLKNEQEPPHEDLEGKDSKRGRGSKYESLVKRMSVSARATEKSPGPGAESMMRDSKRQVRGSGSWQPRKGKGLHAETTGNPQE